VSEEAVLRKGRHMGIRSKAVEWFLKSRVFSVLSCVYYVYLRAVEWFLKSWVFSALLCAYCVYFAYVRTQNLLAEFDWFELLHLVFNVTLAALFLTRTRPIEVSMNPVHWIVAVVTSFSGFLFVKEGVNSILALVIAAEVLMIVAAVFTYGAALALGRSFGFLPGLRRIKTGLVYRVVRHPMYFSSILLRVGYVLRCPSVRNAVLLALIAILYDRRAGYEEDILSNDSEYSAYMKRVKYRFVPWVR
jgi:protein-S-isoprenylcysteine O-methyltransferase Ste14